MPPFGLVLEAEPSKRGKCKAVMYVLDHLAGRYGSPSDTNAAVTEYRLLCSGELYNGRIQAFDWRKSDVTRNLLSSPCLLRVVSRPFDDYPQELSLHVSAPESVTESKGNSVLMRRPDDDIAKDLAALLTLFLRRLITVFVKTRISRTSNLMLPPDMSSGRYDWALPIANPEKRIAWRKKPVSIGWSVGGAESLLTQTRLPSVSIRRNWNRNLERC
jgi:hypothetical protein